MLRLTPPGFERFVQARRFEVSYGGAEASVATSLVNYGVSSAFVTCLPSNEIGQAAANSLRQFGVDVSHIIRRGERIGVYFVEVGSNQRPSKVIYDRSASAISEVKLGSIPWNDILGAEWFHFTGITPAISHDAADVTLEALTCAKEAKFYGRLRSELQVEIMEIWENCYGDNDWAHAVCGHRDWK